MKENYQKVLKKLSSFFPFKPSPIQWTKLSKTKGAWNYWPVTLQVTQKVQKNSFISYVLSDQVWWCIIKWFLNYSKNYICKFMEANSWHLKIFHFHLSFSIWKVWKWREKITKIWIFEEGKELFIWNNKKKIHSFWKAIIWWKIKNLMKNSRHKVWVNRTFDLLFPDSSDIVI